MYCLFESSQHVDFIVSNKEYFVFILVALLHCVVVHVGHSADIYCGQFECGGIRKKEFRIFFPKRMRLNQLFGLAARNSLMRKLSAFQSIRRVDITQF